MENKMIIINTIQKKFPVEWAKASVSDTASQLPFCVFRLKDPTEAAHDTIRRCVESFKGNLEWTIYRCNESRHQNYYLSPTCLWEQYRKEPSGFHFKERFEQEELERLYTQAVLDMEPLAGHLTQCFERMK